MTTTPTPASQPSTASRCSCPSGDGDLRWPCPRHTPDPEQPSPVAAKAQESAPSECDCCKDIRAAEAIYGDGPPESAPSSDIDLKTEFSDYVRWCATENRQPMGYSAFKRHWIEQDEDDRRATAGNAAPTELAAKVIANEKPLDAESHRLFNENRWDMYASNAATAAPGDLPMHHDPALVDAYNKGYEACIASNAGAAPAGLDEAAAYRLWRDCEISEDCWFMQHIANYLPSTQHAPTAAEWDAAMLRVMQDRAAAPVGSERKAP